MIKGLTEMDSYFRLEIEVTLVSFSSVVCDFSSHGLRRSLSFKRKRKKFTKLLGVCKFVRYFLVLAFILIGFYIYCQFNTLKYERQNTFVSLRAIRHKGYLSGAALDC